MKSQIEDIFFSAFSQYVSREDILILAVSGGVDSMTLLNLVLLYHPKDLIIVAHFDHSLRGRESDGDREFIAKYCNNRNIRYVEEKMDISALAQSEKMSIESVARKYRYNFLYKIAQMYRAKYILTAHHQDDRIETALFNLIRGSKLGGIHALSQSLVNNKKCIIIRPLLSVEKRDIIQYADEHNIPFREDSSNTDGDYLRNHIRCRILPEFEKINPEYRKSLEDFIQYTRETKDWIDDEVEKFLGNVGSFSVSDFQRQSRFFQKEIIRYIYETTNNGTIGLSDGNIQEILRFILTAKGGTIKELGNMKLRKSRNIVSIESPS